jgi:hypothetical protein
MEGGIPLLALIPVAGVVVALFVRLFRNANREVEAKSWPSTEATIQSAEIETVDRGRSAVELPCFAFSYAVNGEYYSGRFSLSRDDARLPAFLREMIDQKVTIKYDPKRPGSFSVKDVFIEGCEVQTVPD